MSRELKEIDLKNCTYYFFHDMTNAKNFNSNKFKINEKSYKNILIYHIGLLTVKHLSYATTISVNPSYFIVNKINGYFVSKLK